MVSKRVLLLAAMGLGALYLIHLLASDYQKIRKPAAKLAKFLISKRDLSAVSGDSHQLHSPEVKTSRHSGYVIFVSSNLHHIAD